MKGNAVIFVVVAILALLAMGFFMFKDYFINSPKTTLLPSPSPTYSTFSEDPKYKEVKEKYNLSEEQLQILSTVNPEDND